MADLPPIRRFITEDYPDLDERFLTNLNIVIEAVINGLNGKLNFQNIAGDLFERRQILKNTNITPSQPLKLQWLKESPPAAVICGGIWQRGADRKTSLNITVTIEWDYAADEKILYIKRINGLSLPSTTLDYEITLIAFSK